MNLAIIADHRQAGHYRGSPSLASPPDRGRSPPVAPSAATRLWSTVRSASAGTPGWADHPPHGPATSRRDPAAERGARAPPRRRHDREHCARYAPGFPMDRAAVLVVGMVEAPLPPQPQALMTSLGAGHGLYLYIGN